MQRLKAEDFARITVGLLFVDVDKVNQVAQAIVSRRDAASQVDPSSSSPSDMEL